MTQKKRRLFTNEQKAEALRIVEEADKPIKQVAKDLGIGVSTANLRVLRALVLFW